MNRNKASVLAWFVVLIVLFVTSGRSFHVVFDSHHDEAVCEISQRHLNHESFHTHAVEFETCLVCTLVPVITEYLGSHPDQIHTSDPSNSTEIIPFDHIYRVVLLSINSRGPPGLV